MSLNDTVATFASDGTYNTGKQELYDEHGETPSELIVAAATAASVDADTLTINEALIILATEV
jgi:hypothetical protein